MGQIRSYSSRPALRRLGRISVLTAAVLLAACGSDDSSPASSGNTPSPGNPGSPVASRPMDLTILHINDHHSNLDSKSKKLTFQAADGTPTEITVDAGGFARVKTAFDELSANKANVLKLHAGDALTGTLYFNRTGAIGEADAAMMNTVCFDAFSLGNHEFDKGDTELRNFIQRLHTDTCKTPVLSANVQFGANSALHASRDGQLVQPHTVLERDGQKIGIVGLTISGKTKASSSPDADTLFEDEITAAQRTIDTLTSQNIDKIIVLSHIGYQNDKDLAASLRGVDVVVGGDSHTLLGPDAMATMGVGTPGGAYPTVLKNKDGDQVCVVQAWEYSQVVGELNVAFDEHGRVTECKGTPHVLIGDLPANDNGASLQAANADASTASPLLPQVQASGFLRITQPNAQAQSVLAPHKEAVEVFKKTQVAHVPEILCSRRVPGGEGSADYGRSGPVCNALGDVNIHGGDIQQLVAQAYLEVANANYGGADFTLQSGGGVRVPMEGTVTAEDVITVLPFGNMLWSMSITGAEARAMIEDGLDATFRQGGSTGPYPYAGGLRWDVNASRPKGERASNFQVHNAVTNTWEALDDTRTYRLFVLSFNAEGGDGYDTLRDIPKERRQDIGILDADVLQTYIDMQPKDLGSGLPLLRKLPKDLYSTQSFVGP